MPPFVPRKREREHESTPPSKKAATKRTKPTLFEAADAPSKDIKSAEESKKYLDSLGEDDVESPSDAESDEFEDVVPSKKRKTGHALDADEESDDADSDEDEMEWEDALGGTAGQVSTPAAASEREIADVSIFSIKGDRGYVEPDVSFTTTGKKGPSKRERQTRVLTHCLHVQWLMWHNIIRNSWLNDDEVQKTLVDGLPEGVQREIRRWRDAMGTLSKEELDAKKKQAAKAKKGGKGKGKSSGRDWNYDAQHSEQGVPNLSQGDPLLRLLKVLTAYWRKRFTVTAPAFRKRGYMSLRRLNQEVSSWKKDNNAEEHGERVESIEAFRQLAKDCEGSRDVGGQLFVALLRGLGLETRVIANLQPAGFGWSKSEEADPNQSKKDKKEEAAKVESGNEPDAAIPETKKQPNLKTQKGKLKEEKPSRSSTRGNRGDPISLDDSDSPLSDPPCEGENGADVVDDDDDLSVIDVTPAMPKKKSTKKYDRDLAFPTYWAEVCSPASHKFIPVDPIVLSTIASNDELLQTFEPRGKKAENTKQVICYVIAFSADGTAKDVTVRYLKKHQLPGKTKGMRLPAEKLAIYNHRGKVKKYEDYDWFRTVMSGYERPHIKRTPADDLEEQTDLKTFKASKETKEVAKESLQWYKQSAEFVLEQHLRREEAILPDAEPIKIFTAGKGDKAQDHPVYRREDVVVCKTVESWHKEGRIVKTGEQPMKHVPVRAVTIQRKREVEEAQRETGEKLKQGLYSGDQTEWIIPPPIENGVIPKNAFGNMDVYVDTMVPKGAVHLPLKGSAKLCRKLQIDYAEACTGFEFGKQRAVPILTGVVVAQENAKIVRDAWREDQKEQKRKEDTKRTAAALHWWRKMAMGLRIVSRMQNEYEASGNVDEINPFVRKAKTDTAGSFLPEGYVEDGHSESRPRDAAADEKVLDFGGGFLPESDNESTDHGEDVYHGDGGFIIEEEAVEPSKALANSHAPITPVSLQEANGKPEALNSDEEMDDPEDCQEVRNPARANRSSRTATSRRAKPPTVPKGKGKSKAIPNPPSDDTELDDAELSEVSEAAPSPKVIVKRNAGKSAAPKGQSARSSAKKATPVKSQYFESDDDLSSEQEVIKPTRTTARTRKNA